MIAAQLFLIGLANSMVDQLIAHHAAVYVAVLQLADLTRASRIGHPAAQRQIAMLPFYFQRMIHKGGAADSAQTPQLLAFLRGGAVLTHQLAVMGQGNGDIETRQRNTPHHLINMSELGLFGAHKLAARRRVVKEVEHFQRGARRMRGGFDRHRHIAPFGIRLPGFLLFSGARGQRQARNGADARQRLAAKAQADDRFQIVQRRDFTGGVTRERHRQFRFADAAAVVTDANQLRAALFNIDIDTRGASIEAIFHQFLNDRRRSLDHFTGGDLVG